MKIILKNNIQKKISSGFTTIELIVVMSIFAMMATLVLFNYRDFGSGINLENTSQEIALQVQKAQNYAISGRYPPFVNIATQSVDPSWRPSYGVYFSKNSPKQFVFFFDANIPYNLTSYTDGNFNALTGRGYFDDSSLSAPIKDLRCGVLSYGFNSECLDIVTIASNETIIDLCKVDQFTDCSTTLGGLSNLSIVFTRPFPDRVALFNKVAGLNDTNMAEGDVRIRVQGEGSSNGCRDIYITALGQIFVKSAVCMPGA